MNITFICKCGRDMTPGKIRIHKVTSELVMTLKCEGCNKIEDECKCRKRKVIVAKLGHVKNSR